MSSPEVGRAVFVNALAELAEACDWPPVGDSIGGGIEGWARFAAWAPTETLRAAIGLLREWLAAHLAIATREGRVTRE